MSGTSGALRNERNKWSLIEKLPALEKPSIVYLVQLHQKVLPFDVKATCSDNLFLTCHVNFVLLYQIPLPINRIKSSDHCYDLQSLNLSWQLKVSRPTLYKMYFRIENKILISAAIIGHNIIWMRCQGGNGNEFSLATRE